MAITREAFYAIEDTDDLVNFIFDNDIDEFSGRIYSEDLFNDWVIDEIKAKCNYRATWGKIFDWLEDLPGEGYDYYYIDSYTVDTLNNQYDDLLSELKAYLSDNDMWEYDEEEDEEEERAFVKSSVSLTEFPGM